MKRLLSLALLLAVCPLACKDKTPATPDANTAPAPASTASAAATYHRVAESLDPDTKEKLGDADLAVLRPILASRGADVEALIEASKAADASFGVDYRKDLNTMVPHLGKIRPCARLLAADAKRCIADNDGDGAAKRLASIVRIARQLSADGHLLIEFLVGVAVIDLAAKEAVAGAAVIKSAAWKTDLQTQLASINPMNPLRLRETLAAERDMCARSLRDNTASFADFAPSIAKLSPAEREQAAKDIEAAYGDIIKAWDAPNRKAAIDAAMKSPAATGNAATFVGSVDKVFTAADRLNASVAEAKRAIAN